MCMCPFFLSTLLSFSLLKHEVIKKRLANLRYARVVYVPRNKKRNIKSKREEREQQTTITKGEKEIEDKRKEILTFFSNNVYDHGFWNANRMVNDVYYSGDTNAMTNGCDCDCGRLDDVQQD